MRKKKLTPPPVEFNPVNILSSGVRSRKMPPWLISEISITPLVGGGLNHQLRIRSGEFIFDGNFDNNMHNFFAVISAAMKFFGVQYGTITLDKDGTARPTNKGFN